MEDFILFLDKYNSLIVFVALPVLQYLKKMYDSHQEIISELQTSNSLLKDEIKELKNELKELKKIVLGIYATPDIMEQIQKIISKGCKK